MRIRPIPLPSASAATIIIALFKTLRPVGSIRFHCAPIRFIHFNDPTQPLATRPHHGLSQFMEHQPGCSVAAQAENPLQSQGTDAVFLAGHTPHGSKPSPHRQVSVLEDSSYQYGNLPTAFRTKPETTSHLPKPADLNTGGNKSRRANATNQI